MKLSSILENVDRKRQLTIQQNLLDKLPDCWEVTFNNDGIKLTCRNYPGCVDFGPFPYYDLPDDPQNKKSIEKAVIENYSSIGRGEIAPKGAICTHIKNCEAIVTFNTLTDAYHAIMIYVGYQESDMLHPSAVDEVASYLLKLKAKI